MSTTTNLITADEFESMGDIPYELLRGKLIQVMSPAGFVHGKLMLRLSHVLQNYIEQHGGGEALSGDVGFILARDPDTVLGPDLAFVSQTKLDSLTEPFNYVPLVPDVVIEIISVNDTFKSAAAKAREYIGFGVPLVIVVNPKKKLLHVHRPGEAVVDVTDMDVFDCGAAAPGLNIDTAVLFKGI